MSHSTLDPDNLPIDDGNETHKGHDVRSLGPSDSSDSGSDMVGLGRGNDTSDRQGTGERMSATVDPQDIDALDAMDINTDRIANPEEVGLGGGLDQAEEAQLGITDEEIREHFRRQRHS